MGERKGNRIEEVEGHVKPFVNLPGKYRNLTSDSGIFSSDASLSEMSGMGIRFGILDDENVRRIRATIGSETVMAKRDNIFIMAASAPTLTMM